MTTRGGKTAYKQIRVKVNPYKDYSHCENTVFNETRWLSTQLVSYDQNYVEFVEWDKGIDGCEPVEYKLSTSNTELQVPDIFNASATCAQDPEAPLQTPRFCRVNISASTFQD